MADHSDILEQPERLARPFWVSLTLHVVMLGGLAVGAWADRHRPQIGDPNGGGIGGMLVNPVSSIPLPNRGGPENPVANPTQSQVPAPPAPKEKLKPLPKIKTPVPDAVPLKSEKAPNKRLAQLQQQAQPSKFQPKINENQLTSPGGSRVSSQNYQTPGGGGGPTLGNNSPFGEQFGYYANIIRQNIASVWKPVTVGGSIPAAVVTFTIQRNGAVTNVKVSQSSGNQTLDFSAQRAVMDATLPALPPTFPRNQADVEMKFELGK